MNNIDSILKLASIFEELADLNLSPEESLPAIKYISNKPESTEGRLYWNNLKKLLEQKDPEAIEKMKKLKQYQTEYHRELRESPKVRKEQSAREALQKREKMKSGGLAGLLLKLRVQTADRKSDAIKHPNNPKAIKFLELEKAIYQFRNNCKQLALNAVNPQLYLSPTIGLGNNLIEATSKIVPSLSKTIVDIVSILNEMADNLKL